MPCFIWYLDTMERHCLGGYACSFLDGCEAKLTEADLGAEIFLLGRKSPSITSPFQQTVSPRRWNLAAESSGCWHILLLPEVDKSALGRCGALERLWILISM